MNYANVTWFMAGMTIMSCVWGLAEAHIRGLERQEELNEGEDEEW